jgi:hypothetical protein
MSLRSVSFQKFKKINRSDFSFISGSVQGEDMELKHKMGNSVLKMVVPRQEQLFEGRA